MISEYFEALCKNIEIKNDMVLRIISIGQKITNIVSKYYDTDVVMKESRFIGSFGRNTAVYTENIRLMIALPVSIYLEIQMNAEDLIRDIKKALFVEFKTCEYSDNGNGLNINIGGDLSFEIVPGFMIGKGIYIYLCNNEWKQLNLRRETESIERLNLKTNNALIDLCRMLKVWKVVLQTPDNKEIIESNILLDTLAYHFFNRSAVKQYTYENYDEMVVDFFNFILPVSKKKEFISIDEQTVLMRKGDLYDSVFYSLIEANSAIYDVQIDCPEDAVKRWRNIFGNEFGF